MKRVGTFFIILVVLYSVYYDLTIGTLPNGLSNTSETITTIENQAEAGEQGQDELSKEDFEPFQEVIVEPGQTVLSIVEHLHEGPIGPSIQEIVHDFETLNHGLRPEEIQIGETYLFPIYY